MNLDLDFNRKFKTFRAFPDKKWNLDFPSGGEDHAIRSLKGHFVSIGLLRYLWVILFFISAPANAQSPYTVSRVIDGNTLELSNGEKVLVIGVDCAESEDEERNKRNAERFGIDPEHYASYAEKAKVYVDSFFKGKEAELEFDPANEDIDHKDKYGRTLAYVYTDIPILRGLIDTTEFFAYKNDNIDTGKAFLNATVIKSGHGVVYRRFDFKYKDKFLELEKEAKEKERGIWG